MGSEDIPISVPGPTRGKPFPIFRESINPSHWLIYVTWNMPIALMIFQWILQKKSQQLNKNPIYSKKRALLFYERYEYLWATNPWINIIKLWSWKYLNAFRYLQMAESDHRMQFSNTQKVKNFHRDGYWLKQASQLSVKP